MVLPPLLLPPCRAGAERGECAGGDEPRRSSGEMGRDHVRANEGKGEGGLAEGESVGWVGGCFFFVSGFSCIIYQVHIT